MKIIGTVLFLLVVISLNLSASVHMRQYREVVLDEELDATGSQYLLDINEDGEIDILFDLDSKIGWYSGREAVIKSSIEKKSHRSVSRAYAMGFFDGDSESDYVESVIDGNPLELKLVYYLSSEGLSGADTVLMGLPTGGDISYDPFLSYPYFVIGPYIDDRDEDGIDEVYTGYYYYDSGCIISYCTHTSTLASYYSYQYGEAGLGNVVAVPSSYEMFSRDGSLQIVSLGLSNIRDFGELWGLGIWDRSPLKVAVNDDQSEVGSVMLSSNALCVASDHSHFYSINVTSSQMCDPRDGYFSALWLARVRLQTSTLDCLEDRFELVGIDLSDTGALTVNWREVAPDWATSDIIFADTSSPGQIFLSNGERIYQVREESFQILDSSDVANLSGHMIGYKPLASGEAPSLVLVDGDRVKFYRFDILTDVDDNMDQLPTDFMLSQNYPNPFNPTTEISFSLAKGTNVTLTVFNALGQEVKVLEDRFVSAGTHTISWDGTGANGVSVASGVYLYRLNADGVSESKKMLLLK